MFNCYMHGWSHSQQMCPTCHPTFISTQGGTAEVLHIQVANKYEELINRRNEVLKYCEPHIEQMWAARVVGILLDCDFRDAANALKFSN